VLSNLASLAVERREFERAESIYRQGLALAREADNPARASNVLLGLGHLSYLRGELGPAVTHLRETLRLAREIGYTHMAAYALAILAEVATAAGDYERAALLFGAVEARFAAMDTHLFPKDREGYDRNRAIASAQLGEVAWQQAWQAGQAMRFDTVVEYALGAGGESSPAAPSGVAMLAGTDVRSPLAPVVAEAIAPPASWPAPGLAAPAEAPPLRVRALGPLEIEREGEPLGPEALPYAKPRELLLYLLAHPAGRTRQQIALDLWPEASAAQAKNSFHVTLHHLRKGLGRPEWVLFAEERYCIAPAARAEFDALLFEEQVTAALRDLRAGAGSAARLRTALSLYRGDLLQEEVVGDWHLELRDRLRRLYVDGLSAFGEQLMEDGAFAEAASVYQQIVRLEDLHEEAHRQLLLCLARSGERTRALRHYERLVALLREELDTAPDAATTELYERLRRAEPV
jgi:DNA-binding SARP family transcriptional activator